MGHLSKLLKTWRFAVATILLCVGSVSTHVIVFAGTSRFAALGRPRFERFVFRRPLLFAVLRLLLGMWACSR
jgi:hypothetical protein